MRSAKTTILYCDDCGKTAAEALNCERCMRAYEIAQAKTYENAQADMEARYEANPATIGPEPSSPPCIKCGEIYWGSYAEPFTCEVCKLFPWGEDEDLRRRLEIAGWRYAYLIGIVTPEKPEDVAVLATDRVHFASLVRTKDGRPLWHCKEATTFVADQTGADRSIAAAWLNDDWNGGGEI